MTNPTNATQPAAAPETATTTGARPAGSGTTGFPNERRKRNIPVATDRRRAENAAAKRKSSERRRLIDPTTCERDYTDCEVEFMNALDDYKRKSGRMFPTCSEVLEVIRSLGYVKVSPAQMTIIEAANPQAASAKPMTSDCQFEKNLDAMIQATQQLL